MAQQPAGRQVMIALAGVGALATVAYWTIWFGVDREWLATAHTDAYYRFENAFPLADGWMALCLALAALSLWQRWASGLLWLLLGGSAALYLGAMDVLFDLENGIYSSADALGVAIELAINLFCLIGGAAAVLWGWRHRRYFDSLDS